MFKLWFFIVVLKLNSRELQKKVYSTINSIHYLFKSLKKNEKSFSSFYVKLFALKACSAFKFTFKLYAF